MTTLVSSNPAGVARGVMPETPASPQLDHFCRVCLLQKNRLLPLTNEFNGTMIPEMLWKVSGTLLNVLEQLPKVICERCLTKLDLAYSIAQEFRKQEELLRSFCWKGALVGQLEEFQGTPDAGKVPYSEGVIQKLLLDTQEQVRVAVKAVEEKLDPVVIEELEDIVEIEQEEQKPDPAVVNQSGEPSEDVVESDQEEQKPDLEVIQQLAEPSEDVIEIDPEDQSEHHYDLICEEDGAELEGIFVDETESQNSSEEEMSIKEEIQEDESDDFQPQGNEVSLAVELLPLAEAKEEEEEWIDELQSEDYDEMEPEETINFTGNDTDDSDYPVEYEEEEVEKDAQKAVKRKKTNPTSNRVIKSIPNEDGQFDCTECGKTFSVRKTFLNHLKRHEHVSKGSFQCQVCLKTFGTKERLARHAEIHARNYTCTMCDHVSKNGHQHRAHRQMHSIAPNKCDKDDCFFFYATPHQLNEHENSSVCPLKKPVKKGPALKSRSCPFTGCSYTAETYGAMYVHKRNRHMKKYTCETCEKSFAYANQLKQHEKLHTGEKPFQCKLCSRSFRRLYSYKEHMAVHEGSESFDCGVCGKSFTRPRYLTAHLQTHSENRPFACSLCGNQYKTNGELTKHVRSKHESLEYGNGNDLIVEDYDYFEDELYV